MKFNNYTSVLVIVLITGFSLKSAAPYGAEVETGHFTNVEMTGKILESNTTDSSEGYLTCMMDGSPLQANSPGIIILYVPGKKEVTIWGQTPTGIISIIIDNVESTGTFAIKGNSTNDAGITLNSKLYAVKKTGTLFTATIESIGPLNANISPDAKAIRGTFQGKLMDDAGNIVEITEGKFSTQ